MIKSVRDKYEQIKTALNAFYVDNDYPRQYLNIFGIRDERDPDEWNDVIGFFTTDGFIHAFEATTDPGRFYTLHPMNPGGAAWMCPGFHEGIWRHGLHRGYPALIQSGGAVRVTRDIRKRYRPGDTVTAGYYGINHHRAHPVETVSKVGRHGAACQVIRRPDDWQFAKRFYDKFKQPDYNYLLLTRDEVKDVLGVEL